MLSFLKRKKIAKNGMEYDPKLIKKFHKDHSQLNKLITNILLAIEENQYHKVKELLKKFKIELLEHFMQEDIKLYHYLKSYYSGDLKNLELITMFEDSIKTIQSNLIKFLDKYAQESTPLDQKFEKEFEGIVKNLSKRVKTEEQSLYTLYKY
jgi:hemerythrin-like domain-containing protein